jgi:hypothetical protein
MDKTFQFQISIFTRWVMGQMFPLILLCFFFFLGCFLITDAMHAVAVDEAPFLE